MQKFKNVDKLILFCLISFVIFNVLFFTHQTIIDWWYNRIDITAKCADDTPNSTDSSGFYLARNCDIASLSKADDIITGTFVLAGVSSAVSGSVLLIRTAERSWKKLKKNQ